MSHFRKGDAIGEWVVDERLGAGGTAAVYACHNKEAPRFTAAVKVLDGAGLRQEDSRARLVREGEVLHGLDHEGIVRVLALRPDADPPFLVMEHVEGPSLAMRMLEGMFEDEAALQLIERLAEAVAYLHERGIQHRDLKPHNVILREETRPCLVDFGLVLEAGSSRLTAEGLRMGTVSYVPPEWANPRKIDPVKWDIYSLGTIFWEILVGRRAFPMVDDVEPAVAVVRLMTEKQGHPPLDPGPGVPIYLRILIRDMTHHDPAQRPEDGAEVLNRLLMRDAGAAMHPVDLFQTPMTAWSAGEEDQPTSAPTLDHLAAEVEAPPMARRRGFWVGATLGFVGTAMLGAGLVGWQLGRMAMAPTAAIEPVVAVPPTPVPAAAPTQPEPVAPPVEAPDPAPVAADPSASEAPQPAATAPHPSPTAPQPTAAPGSGQVTAGAFARWLERHPNWHREAAVASGRADAGYLTGFDALDAEQPVHSVSWYAAMAYCEGRGGLADLDAPPQRWAPETGLRVEWRDAARRPGWRSADGRSSMQVQPSLTSVQYGIRCAAP